MLTRRLDWQSAFAAFLRSHEHSEFRLGTLDCCLFPADGVLALTGVDLAAGFRGRYRTPFGALRCLRAASEIATVACAMEQAAKSHGMPEIAPAFAQRGDLVLVEREGEQSLGLVALDARRIAVIGDHGFVYLPRRRASRAWRV